jgi:hypothetical protein
VPGGVDDHASELIVPPALVAVSEMFCPVQIGFDTVLRVMRACGASMVRGIEVLAVQPNCEVMRSLIKPDPDVVPAVKVVGEAVLDPKDPEMPLVDHAIAEPYD